MSTPDSRLVVERAALPAYEEELTPASKALPALLERSGCLRWLWSILLRFLKPPTPDESIEGLAVEGGVQVLLPPPPGTYGYATLFTPAPEVVQRSRQALKDYQVEYQEPDPDRQPYPWHLVMARHTSLPALMRGFLREQDQFDTPDDVASIVEGWLFQDLRARALFGIEPADAKERFRVSDINYEGEARRSVETPPPEPSGIGTSPLETSHIETLPIETGVIGTLPPRPEPEVDGKRLMHIRYQQWHVEWPVFGGQVVVHLGSRDRRASVTSSYFPLDGDTAFSLEITKWQAMDLAKKALAGYLGGLEAIGLYRSLLAPWLEAQETAQPLTEAWQPVHSYVFEKLMRALATFSKEHDHVFSDLEELAVGGLPQVPDPQIRVLRGIGERLEGFGFAEWGVDGTLFVLPFAGSYHLAYQVRLVPLDYSQAWRVFVDAETRDILGRPENLVFHVQYYATAGDALAGQLESQDLGGKSPCDKFMAVGIYQQGQPPEGDPPPNWSHNQTSGSNFEATNVAIHAKEIYDHFVTVCHAAPDKLQSYQHDGQEEKPGLRARVAAPGAGFPLHQIFNPAADPKLITFPTGILTTSGKQVHHLAYDPEVIYHEVTHGLMWLLNRYPFDEALDSVPFGRALVEGYANYFGRSLASRSDLTSLLWARAAYREKDASGAKMWDDEWALSRSKLLDGQDRLPAPNLYPHQQTTGLPVYDVGMIWARALWDLHAILGIQQVDRLALAAYYFVNGWVANFELAAEGVLDAAAKTGITSLNQKQIRQRFANRGILAGQSIQALIRATDVPLGREQRGSLLLAGADAGLMRSIDGGQHWQDWDDLQGGQKLVGVVALALKGNTFYAAVEAKTSQDAPQAGIYQRASNGTEWSPVGKWPGKQTPYSLAVDDHRLYVGTGHAVWHCNFDDASKKWVVFECPESLSGQDCTDCSKSDNCPFRWVGLDLALASTTANIGDLCIASFDAVRARIVNPGAPWRKKCIGDPSDRAAIVSVAAQNDFAYLGTLAHGVWRRGIGSDVWARIDSNQELSNVAVLALAPHSNVLIAGTTSGLYVGTRDANDTWAWNPRPGLPQGAKVTVVLPMGDQVLASTATHGLWRWDGGQWQEVMGGVEKLVGKS